MSPTAPERVDALAIRADRISKRFRLRSGSIKHTLLERGRPRDEIWAVHDLSFELAAGAALGVVGDNGSGKSTLLKLLSGVMPPTTGSVQTRGRIGTLIEIGAGFHPDLTGRDNVYLNAALLGLRRAEVRRRFDDIVTFAELERFIDTPVKRYSSGMFLRLGFSIAAHVDPDILLIDEVLAVGDASFQRKCLRRLREFRQSGGTMVLVSHGLGLVSEHCQQAIWLDRGVVRAEGDPAVVTQAYASAGNEVEPLAAHELDAADWQPDTQAADLANPTDDTRSDVLGVQILDMSGQPANRLLPGEAIRVRIGFRHRVDDNSAAFELTIVRNDGVRMFTSTAVGGADIPALPSSGDVIVELPFLALAPGMYQVNATLGRTPGARAALEIAGDTPARDAAYMSATWRLAR